MHCCAVDVDFGVVELAEAAMQIGVNSHHAHIDHSHTQEYYSLCFGSVAVVADMLTKEAGLVFPKLQSTVAC